jgi:hypothetical protein
MVILINTRFGLSNSPASLVKIHRMISEAIFLQIKDFFEKLLYFSYHRASTLALSMKKKKIFKMKIIDDPYYIRNNLKNIETNGEKNSFLRVIPDIYCKSDTMKIKKQDLKTFSNNLDRAEVQDLIKKSALIKDKELAIQQSSDTTETNIREHNWPCPTLKRSNCGQREIIVGIKKKIL